MVLRKRSVLVAGHPTSVSLEQPFWDALGEIARCRGTSINGLITELDVNRYAGGGLSSAIRLFVLQHYRALVAEKTSGHRCDDMPSAH